LEKRGREAQEFFKIVEEPPAEKVENTPQSAESPMEVENEQVEPKEAAPSEPVLEENKEMEVEESPPPVSEAIVPETPPVVDTETPPEPETNTEEVPKGPEIDYDIFDEDQPTNVDGVKGEIEAAKSYTPIISGGADEIIDLETGDVTCRPLTGPELLLDQMLKSRGLKNKHGDEEKTVS
jgi:hypothetical protein